MSNINYRDLKRLKNTVYNLPKYDLGSPIDKGYQASSNPALSGDYTKNATPITNAFVPQAISNAVQNVATPLLNVALGIEKYSSAYKTASNQMADKYAQLYTKAGASSGIAEEAFTEAGKSSAKSAASKALGAANIAMNAYGAIHGGIDLVNTLNNTKGLDAGELALGGARYTDPLTGKELWGGLDYAGINKYGNDLKKSAGISGASAGFESGAGIGGLIGSLFPGAGTLIGSGIGGVVGAIGGLLGGLGAGKKAKRRMLQAVDAYNYASLAHNAQEESEGMSEQMRLNADKGRSLEKCNKGKANAMVGALETKVRYNNGKPTKAYTYPIEPGKHYWRGDDYYDELKDNDAVVGNLPDPLTGTPLSFEALPYSAMLQHGNKAQKEYASLALDEILQRQKVAQKIDKNNMKYYADKGRSLRKYNYGTPSLLDFSKGINLNNYSGAWIPTTSHLFNMANDYARKKAVENDPIVIPGPARYANTQMAAILRALPYSINIQDKKNALNNAFRNSIYSIWLSGLSPAQKMAMLSTAHANFMKNNTSILTDKINAENELGFKSAQFYGGIGSSEASLLHDSDSKYNDSLKAGYAQKRALLDTIARDSRAGWNSFAENLNNILWGNKNIGLYLDKQNLDKERLNFEMGEKSTPAALTTPVYTPIQTFDDIINDPEKLAEFNRYIRKRATFGAV